ncbi:MAG: glycosyltransferase, partial [Betaproteobacteria bacterium]
ARALGDWSVGLAAGLAAARRDPLDFDLVDQVFRSVVQVPASLLPRAPPSPRAGPLPTPSIVVVSRDDDRFAAVDVEYRRALAAWPHQRVRIRNAVSMYDGYARGFAQGSGDIVVFSHDDVRIARDDFAARLADALATADVVGIAGTTLVTGPSMLGAGHPHLHGAITHDAAGSRACEFGVLSLSGPRIADAQGLDGVFPAARRKWIERIGFDAARLDGFHFYDLDFSYRSHLAGARVAIACDLALVHASRGTHDARYAAAQQQFAAKFPQLAAPDSSHRHWYAMPAADPEAAAALHGKLLAAWALPPL